MRKQTELTGTNVLGFFISLLKEMFLMFLVIFFVGIASRKLTGMNVLGFFRWFIKRETFLTFLVYFCRNCQRENGPDLQVRDICVFN